jgi:TM2 domain-containing membrane protein YozV
MGVKKKSKSVRVGYLLAFFFGGLGFHLFYYRKYFRAVAYLLFSWTLISVFLGWIDMFFVKRWTRTINGIEKSLDLLPSESEKKPKKDPNIVKELIKEKAQFLNSSNALSLQNEIKNQKAKSLKEHVEKTKKPLTSKRLTILENAKMMQVDETYRKKDKLKVLVEEPNSKNNK